MTFALIEVEAMAKKAARGAGYSWGMAEEAANATRWLCAAGFDGVAALAVVLAQTNGLNQREMAPSLLAGDWQAGTGTMCPLMAGATLSDCTDYWAKDGKRIANVIAPILLVPFAASSARQLGTTVTLETNDARVVTDGSAISISSKHDAALFATAETINVRTGGQLDHPLPAQLRANPSDADWATLNTFAHRTYAPDTEASRLRGAGAGLTDND